MSTFLQQVAADLLQKHPGLKDIAIVMPSRRAAVFLKKEFSKQITQPVWTPEITTIEDFFMEALGLEQADQPTLMFRLYESYSAVAGDAAEDFADFSQWAHLLLADFNEVDRYLIDAKHIFSYLSDVERIKKWDLQGGEMTEMVKNYLKLWELLPEVYVHFYQKLLAEKSVYQGIAYREMAESLEAQIPQLKKQYGNLIFIGFNALNTAEEKILRQLYREGIAHFYWDVDDYYFKDTDQEAGSFLRKSKLVKELIEKEDFHWRHDALAKTQKEIEIINVNGNHLQAIAANAAVADFKARDLQDVAVVLADEDLLQTFLNNLSDDVESLNVTMGLPLKGTPAAGFFSMLLQMLQEQEHTGRRNAGVPAFHYQKWDDLLGHFIFKLWSGNSQAVEDLRVQIRQRNRIFISAEELAEWQGEVFTKEMADFFNSDYTEGLSLLWRDLAQITEGLHLKDAGKNSLLQSLFGFYKTFNRLADLMSTYPYVKDVKTAARFFRDLLGQETLDLKGDPLSGLQVMGMLETRTLDFPNLVITSLNEETLPKGRSENSLIPFDIKREFDLPTYLEKDAVFAYHFYRLLQRAEKVTLIYNGATEGLRSGEPSRFLKQLEYEFGESNKGSAPIKIRNVSFDISLEDIAEEEIEKTPAVMQRLSEMAEKGFSPTALIDYINDPVEFYKKRVLNLQEAEEVEEVAGYDTQGNVVHELLEGFYSVGEGDEKTAKPELDASDPVFAQSEDDIRGQVVEWLEREAHLRDLDSGKNLVIREILTGMVFNFLRKEKAELEEMQNSGRNFQLVALEQKYEAEIGLSDGRVVKIKGIIDRIDQVDWELRLIDYKTGFVDAKALRLKEMEDLRQPKDQNKSLQLMTYGWLCLQNNPDITTVFPGIISLRNVKQWFLPLSFQKNKEIHRETLREFEGFLTNLLEEIFDPARPFSKKPLALQAEE